MVLLTGCATKTVTEYIEVRAECELPPKPVPTLDWDGLNLPFDYLPEPAADEYDQALDDLEAYEATLIDSLKEHRAIIRTVCAPPA